MLMVKLLTALSAAVVVPEEVDVEEVDVDVAVLVVSEISVVVVDVSDSVEGLPASTEVDSTTSVNPTLNGNKVFNRFISGSRTALVRDRTARNHVDCSGARRAATRKLA